MGGQKPPSSRRSPTPPASRCRFRAACAGRCSAAPRASPTVAFHRLTLVPFLAWIGLGADGLSSSAYGPDEAFRTLGEHTYLLLVLAVMTTVTVLVISAAYKRIIEEFPHGGGGYVVATKLLGPNVGVVSGCALLVDYVLTIAVSIAAAGDAIFSFLPLAWHGVKPVAEVAFVLGLIVLNIRGVRESVMVLLPVFLVFLLTHAVAIVVACSAHAGQAPAVAAEIGGGFSWGTATLGLGGMAALLLKAYSMGGGTYTGIEAVSNGLPIMREPRAKTGRRTMTYMAASLSFTAAGLLVCDPLWRVSPVEGKTMNAVLFERMAGGLPLGMTLVWITLLSEGLLLVVAAQAGFIDGPRVLANMALDNWMPRRFATLSSRLTTQNGIVLMGVLALVVLLYTHGDVRSLVVMYSINVFLTFSLSMLAMTIWTVKSAPSARIGAGGPGSSDRSAALRHGAGRHDDREVRRGRLDHHRGNHPAAGPVLPDPRPLPAGRRQARPKSTARCSRSSPRWRSRSRPCAASSIPRSRPPRCWSPATAAWACTRC